MTKEKTVDQIFAALGDCSPGDARDNMVLLVQAGSRSLGCQTEDSSDEDFIGVFVEPKNVVLGLRTLDYWEQSTGEKDIQKGHGDVEVKLHGLKKFVSLARKGNPDVLSVLYAPLVDDPAAFHTVGKMLRDNRHIFSSRLAGKRYLGYMNGQMKNLTTGVGMNVKRPALVEKYGYDTKYAYHVLRLGQQGIDFLNTGELILPLPAEQRDYLMDVRSGRYTLDEIKAQAAELDEKLKNTLDTSTLPDEPDMDAVNTLLEKCYETMWYGK